MRCSVTRLVRGISVVGLATAIVVGVGTQTSRSEEEALPEAIQKIYKEIESDIDRTARRVGRFNDKQIEQNIRQLKQQIEEFALDAELFDDDPLLLELEKRLLEIAGKNREAKKDRAEKVAEANKIEPVDEVALRDQIDKMLELPVDMDHLSFKRDVAPLIQNVCMGCHTGRGRGVRGSGFDLGTFNGFMSRIEPGNPLESLVFLKVSGQAEKGRKMPPAGMSRFDLKWGLLWQRWIQDGTPFDGPDKNAPILSYVISHDVQRDQMIARMSEGDVRKLHKLQSRYHVSRVNPDQQVFFRETGNYLIYTTLAAEDSEYVEALAEAVLEELKEKFSFPKDKPVWRGGLGLSVFADRFDYVTFAKNVDGRTPESYNFGHATIKPEHQYVGMTTDVDNYELDGLIAEQVTNAFVATMSREGMPDWASYGFARAIAARNWDESPAYAEEIQQALRLVTEEGRQLQSVFGADIPWIEQAPMAASFFNFALEVDEAKTIAFIKMLPNGNGRANWQAAASSALGVSVADLNLSWMNWLKSNAGNNKKKRKRRRK